MKSKNEDKKRLYVSPQLRNLTTEETKTTAKINMINNILFYCFQFLKQLSKYNTKKKRMNEELKETNGKVSLKKLK